MTQVVSPTTQSAPLKTAKPSTERTAKAENAQLETEQVLLPTLEVTMQLPKLDYYPWVAKRIELDDSPAGDELTNLHVPTLSFLFEPVSKPTPCAEMFRVTDDMRQTATN